MRQLGVKGCGAGAAMVFFGWYATACGETQNETTHSTDASEVTGPNASHSEPSSATTSKDSAATSDSADSGEPGASNTDTNAGASDVGDSGAIDTGVFEPGETSADTSSSGQPTPTDGSPGCGAALAAGALEPRTLEIDGVERRYIVSVPANYDPAHAYPLLFAFHGGGDNGQSFMGWSGVESVAEGIYIYPDGVNGIWAEEVYNDDFRLERAAYEWTAAHFCVDPARVFAWGFSWGGWVTTQFACNSPDLLRGVVEIAGGGPQRNCDVPVAMMLIHGTADEAEPISSSESTLARFTELNGCSQDTAVYDPEPCQSYTGCEAPVVWCRHDGPHGIPEFAPSAIANFMSTLE